MKEYVWDFNEVIGDTIKAKYENLVRFTWKIAKVLGEGEITLISSREVTSIFETSTRSFTPLTAEEWKMADKFPLVRVGSLLRNKRRAHIYYAKSWPTSEAILTANNKSARIKLCNFIL